MDAESIRKRIDYFEGNHAPSIPFEQVNLTPIIKAIQAHTSEIVDRMYGEPYPRIEDL